MVEMDFQFSGGGGFDVAGRRVFGGCCLFGVEIQMTGGVAARRWKHGFQFQVSFLIQTISLSIKPPTPAGPSQNKFYYLLFLRLTSEYQFHLCILKLFLWSSRKVFLLETEEKMMMIQKAEKKITALRPRKVITANRGWRKVVAARRSKPEESVIGFLKKKKFVSEIDRDDVNNILAGVEYVEDLYEFYKLAENQVGDYMDRQTEIDAHTRLVLVFWLIDVQYRLKFPSEVLFLTVHIVDRYLEQNLVAQKDLPLVGLSAMLIAGKYEEDKPPGVEEFVTIASGFYNREKILSMEKSILEKLGWSLTVPNTYHFLIRFVKAAGADKEIEDSVFFMAELGLMQYEMMKFCPSMLAASAVYAAKLYLKKTPLWNETLEFHTGYSELQLTGCAQKLLSFHSEAPDHLQTAYYHQGI